MRRLYLYSLPIRTWHWINAAVIVTLLVTGAQLRAPDLGLMGFRSAVLLHRYAGYVMTASFLFWLVYTLAAGDLKKYYAPTKDDLRGAARQAHFYLLGMFRGAPPPFCPSAKEKFNPLQKIAYNAIMLVFSPLIAFTGILFSDVLLFRHAISLLGGIKALDVIHLVVAYVFLLYFLAHVYMSMIGRDVLAHIRAMFTGFEE